MLYPSPTTDRIYIAFEHDDVKIFDPATRDQDLNIQKDQPAYDPDQQLPRKDKDELWIRTDSGLFIYKVNTGECTRIRQDPLDPYALFGAILSLHSAETGRTACGFVSTKTASTIIPLSALSMCIIPGTGSIR